MTEQYATLTIEGDPDGDGSTETGVFVMGGNLEVTPGMTPEYLIGGRGGRVNSIIANLVDPGESTNQQFFLDAGAGAFTIEVQFRGWEGAQKSDGTPLQWGNEGAADTPTAADATGADPVTQIGVLFQYILTGDHDSRNPATLEWGEWSSSGLFSPLEVVLNGPTMTRAAEDGSWFDGSLTCIQAASLSEPRDARQQLDP